MKEYMNEVFDLFKLFDLDTLYSIVLEKLDIVKQVKQEGKIGLCLVSTFALLTKFDA